MRAFGKKPATYQDLIDLPSPLVGEIVDGELHASPRPAFGHASAASTLGMDLGSPFQRGRGGPGGWWIFDEPELHFGTDVLVPDLAGWRRERMPSRPNVPYSTLAPDWICEVLSPSTAGFDRVRKMPVYLRAGVIHAWLLDPIGRSLEIYRRQESGWLLTATYGDDQDRVRAEPFDAIELELSALWLTEAPPTEPAP